MAFNGSGVHNRVHDWTQDLSNSIPVTASRMDSEHDDISTALSSTICRDGQSTTTARIPFASGLSAAAGTTSAVAYAQTNDTNTGLYFPATDQVGIVAGGTEAATITSSGITVTGTLTPSGQIVSSAGTAGAPGVTFSSDLDSGLYHIGANNLGVAVNGAKVLDISTAGIGVAGTLTSSGALIVSANGAAITGNSTVTGTFGVSSDLAIATNKFNVIAGSGNTAIAGTLGVVGDVAVNTNKFNVTASNGNTAVAGTLVVAGASTLTGALTANNAAGVTAKNTLKAFGYFTVSGTTVTFDTANVFNIASVVRGGVGLYTVTFTTSLATDTYSVVASSGSQSGNSSQHITPGGRTTSTFTLAVANPAGTASQESGTVSFMVI